MEKYEKIIFKKAPPFAFITFNVPERLNPLGVVMQKEVVRAIEDVDEDPSIRVAIIKGAGKCFSVGYDLEDIDPGSTVAWQVTDRKRDILEDRLRLWTISKRWLTIWDCKKTVIAQIHGFCLAGGTDVAFVCDMTIAAEDAKFGHPGVRGLGTPLSGPWTYYAGPMRAKMLLLTGDTIDGKTAAEWGLISQAVPSEQLEDEVMRLAKRVATIPNDIREINKLCSNRALEMMGFRDTIRDTCEINSISHFMPTVKEFWARVSSDGLKSALKWRDRDFEEIEEFSSYEKKSK